MKTLRDAWLWYAATSAQLYRMERLAEKHWEELPWAGAFGRDDTFRPLRQPEVVEEAKRGTEPLDDLAVLVFFSVFEAQVRAHVHEQVEREARTLEHPSLRHAAQESLQRIEDGSFFRVLEPFKSIDVHLVEKVNQVRRFRNWVAHGRSNERPAMVDPREAFERLRDFLTAIGLTAGDAAP
jgi:hypothetical protein